MSLPDTAVPRPDADDEATSWALAARSGDPVAQAAFVRATQRDVWRLCASLIDRGSADDLAQETFLRAFRSLPAFEARSTARTWLLGIARRVCADHLRTVVRRRKLAAAVAVRAEPGLREPDPAGAVDVRDLLRRLPDERRAAFVLTQVLGLPYAEAAAVEGVPVGTIRSRVARARADLVATLLHDPSENPVSEGN
ncbi:sigma-70 family RNA polymerase sigma factor [Actinorhabdospora filicis]|uniref:sigma-70 family RNA polymerase sigma factor n=1 Tax=Actinorhabdospora filicis TaxID=1785913 RepID=UPI00255580CD|nr:sigma-70 family RNA polymerase sigma factor [Actinorhabdospora filicis]